MTDQYVPKKTIQKKKILIPLAIIICSILISAYLIKSRDKKPASNVKERIWRVETIVAKKGRFSTSQTLYGQVQSPELFHLSSPSMGRIVTLNTQVGQKVKKGDILATLDPADVLPNLTKAQNRLKDIKAQIKVEKLQFQNNQRALTLEKELLSLKQSLLKRNINLLKKNLSSKSAIDELKQQVLLQQLSINKLKLQLEMHPSQLERLKSSQADSVSDIETAQLIVNRSQLTAPFEGYLSAVNIAVGDQVSLNQKLLSLYPIDKLEIKSKLPIKYKSLFLKALNNTVSEPIYAYIKGSQSSHQKLKLSRMDSTADESGIDIFFESVKNSSIADNIDKSLKLGESLTLQVDLPARDNLVVMPYSALYGQDVIYRLIKDSKGIERLDLIKINVVGEYRGKSKLIEPSAKDQSLVLISNQLSQPVESTSKTNTLDGQKIVITHLPNAITGLKVRPEETTQP